MELIRGDVKVEFEDIGEGMSGDYNPKDKNDSALLRLTVWEKINDEWEPVDDGSVCTLVEANNSPARLKMLLQLVMSRVFEPLTNGKSIKKIVELLSWIE